MFYLEAIIYWREIMRIMQIGKFIIYTYYH